MQLSDGSGRRPGRLSGAGLYYAGDGVGVDAARIFGAPSVETELISLDFDAFEGRSPERAGHGLELLLQRQLPFARLPRAIDFGRDVIQQHGAPARTVAFDRHLLFGRPAFDAERV